MSEDAAAAARREKAAARQAKLLAKSNERLAKITGAAKGEGRIVSESTGGIPPRPANVNPAPPTSLADVNDDPAEVDLAAQNPLSLLAGTGGAGPAGAQNPFAALGGQPGGGGADDMFAQMMQQMMAGAGGAGAGAGAGAAGAGGAPPGNPFMQPPTSPFPPAPKTFLDRVFPLVHLVAMVGLAVYAVFVYEPAKRMTAYGWNGSDIGIDWKAWSVLLDHRPQETAVLQKIGIHSLAQVPLLWMFVSVELVLQTTRLFLVRNRPAPPGILNSVLPLLSQFSPQLGLAIQTGVRYFDLFSTCLNDLAVLICSIGLVVLVARWKVGEPHGLVDILEDTASGVVNKVKGEL
ncbi:hypothetical protein Rhopal_005513-T1 [Rhodotorula paludigena]|uniref:Golgi to ER traffic protein 2 n=1 Tax=Rhodotorula paludigena TaxID=86838 RepID=A0AAV5GV67_9BASI|nr:hypothetical protein Rhopal_005513-T1 [Rhodotorula paludigena]